MEGAVKNFTVPKSTFNNFNQFGYDPHGTQSTEVVEFYKQVCSSVSTKPWPKRKLPPNLWTAHSWRRDDRTDDNSFFQRDFSRYPGPGGPTYLGQRWQGTTSFVFGANIDIPVSWFDDVDQAALTNRLLGKVKQMKWNAANSLGEVRQTVDMIAKTANRIASAYAKLRKAMWVEGLPKTRAQVEALRILGRRRPNGLPKKNVLTDSATRQKREVDLANAWLEIQYGWKPLLSDVYEAVQSIQRPRYFMNYARVTSQVDQTLQVTSNGLNSTTGAYQRRVTTCRWHVSRSKTVEFRLSDDFGKHLNSLGLTNPLSLAWELTPYSFVVDWFLPIGNWLDGLDATFGAQFVKGMDGNYNTRDQVFKISCDPYDYPSWGGTGGGSGTAKWVAKVFVRTPFGSFPSPALAFKSPVSVGHAQNALALLTQTFLGRRK
jgi:hypothetical protein